MREKLENTIMKLLSLTAVFLSLYQPAIVLRTLLFRSSGGIEGFIFGMFLIFGGFFAGYFIIIRKNKSVTFAHLTLLVPLTLTLGLFSGKGALRTLFEVFFAGIYYIIGIRSVSHDFGMILSKSRVYSGIFFISVSYLVVSYNEYCKFLKPFVLTSVYVFLVITLLVMNQESLDYNIFSKKSIEKSGVPRNIRRFNIYAVLVFTAMITLLFNLKQVILYLQNTSVMVLKKVIEFCVSLFMKIISLFMVDFVKPQKYIGDKSQQLPKAEAHNNKINSLIFWILICVLFIFILYKLSPVVYRKIRTLILFLISKIKAFLKQEAVIRTVQNEEYTDEVETIKAEFSMGRQSLRKNRKRNAFKVLEKITDPLARVRYMYRIILDILINRNIGIKQADTTKEIMDKVEPIEDAYLVLFKMTGLYERVRYSDVMPEKDEIAGYECDFRSVTGILGNRS